MKLKSHSIILFIILFLVLKINCDEDESPEAGGDPPAAEEGGGGGDGGGDSGGGDKGGGGDGGGSEKAGHETGEGGGRDGSGESCITPGSEYPTVSLNLNGKQQASAGTAENVTKKIKLNRYYAVRRDRFWVQNTDNGILTIQLKQGEPTSRARIRGPDDDWNEEYVFAKMDIYWAKKNDYGSQHAVLGDSYPFEIQLVHYNTKFSTLASAAGSEHGILVVCIVYEVTGMQNPPLDALSGAALMSTFPQDSMQLAHGPLDLKALFPFELSNMQYTGSYMVQPYCSKNAKFVVFVNPRSISYKQLKRFREIRNSDGEKFPGIFMEEEMINIQKTYLSRNVKLSLIRDEFLSSSTSNKIRPSHFIALIFKIILLFTNNIRNFMLY